MALTVAVVNPTKTLQTLSLRIKGVNLSRQCRLWRVSGNDEMAYNEPGKVPVVKIQEIAQAPFPRELEVPAMSISLFELEVRK